MLWTIEGQQGRDRDTQMHPPPDLGAPPVPARPSAPGPFLSCSTARAVAGHPLLSAVGHLEHGPVPGGAVHRAVPHPPTGRQGVGGHLWPARGRRGRRRASQHLAAAETPRTPHQRYGQVWHFRFGRSDLGGERRVPDGSCLPPGPSQHHLSPGWCRLRSAVLRRS